MSMVSTTCILPNRLRRVISCFRMSLFRRCSSAQTFTDEELKRAFTSPGGRPIIAGRPYLAGSTGKGMPQYLDPPRDDFPLVVDMAKHMSTEQLSEALGAKARSILEETLLTFGAVLFKGLPLKTASDVGTFMRHLGVKTIPYVGGVGVRETVDAHVLTASREPPSYTIELHNEMSYTPTYPTHLTFFCEVPVAAGCGGESVFCLNREFQKDIDPEVKQKFQRLGIRYCNFYSSELDNVYLSWQEVFQTKDKVTAERVMSEQGHSYKWHENGALSYWYNLPPTRPHHRTGEDIWFNQLHMNATYFRSHPYWGTLDIPDEEMPFHTYYGDGTPIEPEVLQHLRNVIWKHTVGMRMNQGELLFLDNMLVQHGRLGFVGDRRLLVTLIDDKI